MTTGRKSCVLIMAACGLASAATHGQVPDPVFWYTGSEADQDIVDQLNNPHLVRRYLVHLDALAGGVWPDPIEAANVLCNDIESRQAEEGSQAGKIAVMLYAFGDGQGDPGTKGNPGPLQSRPALWEHWCDGTAHPEPLGEHPSCDEIVTFPGETYAAHWWRSPFMQNGIAECAAWMDAFISRYEVRQQVSQDLPDPTRFLFDVEGALGAGSNTELEAFDFATMDDRWDSEMVAGFPPNPNPPTMADLWDASGLTYIASADWNDVPNRSWAEWFTGTAIQICDGALDEAAYQLIRQAWPDCKSSNYRTSARTDGIDGRHYPLYWTNSDPSWFQPHWKGSGDIQAPQLYYVRGEPDEDWWSLSMERNRILIDSCIHSYDGGHSHEIMPWITLPGDRVYKGDHICPTKADVRELLAMLRSRDIREYGVFSYSPGWSNACGPTYAEAWDQFDDAIRQAWLYDRGAVTVVEGTPTGTPNANLDYALEDYYVIDPVFDLNLLEFRCRFEVEFVNDDFDPMNTQDDGLTVTIEARRASGPAEVDMEIEIWDHTRRTWSWIGDGVLRSEREVTVATVNPNQGAFLDPNTGAARIRITCRTQSTNGFTAEFDSVQVIESD